MKAAGRRTGALTSPFSRGIDVHADRFLTWEDNRAAVRKRWRKGVLMAQRATQTNENAERYRAVTVRERSVNKFPAAQSVLTAPSRQRC